MPKTYLPSHFHYDGMYKIKAGKGYLNQCTGETELFGVKGGPCKECEGTIISLKICTSSKGFQTTTEKVCDTCGLIYPGAFQVLDKPEEDYKGKYYNTHEEWLNDMKKEPEDNDVDIDKYWENAVHIFGDRMGAVSEGGFRNIYDRNARLGKAINRLARTPQSMKIPMQDRREHKYRLLVEDTIHELQLNTYDAEDLRYWLKNRGTKYNTRYKMEDIIYHMGIVIGNKDLRKCKGYNRQLLDLLMDRYHR